MDSMLPFFRKITSRLAGQTDTRLRVVFVAMAIVSLAANILVIVPASRLLSFHSDDLLWVVKGNKGAKRLLVYEVAAESAADKAGIKAGDIVLSINNTPVPPDINAAQDILNAAPVGEQVGYVVERDGVVLPRSIVLVHRFMLVPLIVPVFTLLWLIIGTIVILAQPRGRVQRLFFLTAASVVFAYSFPLDFTGDVSGAFRVGWAVLSLLFYPLWVHFCANFPVRQAAFSRASRVWLLYLLFIVVVLGASIAVDLKLISNIGLLNLIKGVFGFAYFGSGVWLLVRGTWQLPPEANKRPMKVILIGVALASLALIYLQVLQSISSGSTLAFSSPWLLLPFVLILAMPISFGYVVFRYQLMDFSRVVRTTVVYAIITVMVVACYVTLSFALGRGIVSLVGAQYKTVVETLVFVALLLALDPLRRILQNAIENKFFPRQRDYTVHLARFSAELAETVGLQAVADLTARTLQKALNLDSVSVAVENTKERLLRKVARVSPHQALMIPDRVLHSLQSLLLDNRSLIALETLGDPAYDQLQARYPYVVGMYAQGQVVGAALLSRPVDGASISGSQMPLISGVLSQAAAAIEVARLYEEEIERRRYRQELSTAQRIQQSLLPATMPSFPGITISAVARPAEAVGGDYYNVVPIDDNRFAVIVADVSGKGLPAALYMAELHGMTRIAVQTNETPKQILSTLNDNLRRTMERGTFITATVLLFDTARHTVSYARAGHTPIIRRNGATVDPLIPQGFPLGMPHTKISFEDALQEYTVTYEPGETFIMYSDGVSEAMNVRGEEFGDGRLIDIIEAEQDRGADSLCDAILRRVEEFRGAAEQHDDITLMVVRAVKESQPVLSPAAHLEKAG